MPNSWSKKQKQLDLKSRSSAKHAYRRSLINKFRGPKIERNNLETQKTSGTLKIVKKKSEKKVTDVLKDPKT